MGLGELVEEELWVEGAGRRKFWRKRRQSIYRVRVLEKLLR